MAKTAYVYDKWFSSLGGGEVVASHIGLALHKMGYKTTIISGLPVDISKVKSVLGIDLSPLNFKYVFNDQTAINVLTKNSDIFINCSFWDYTTSKARKNFYYCFFPTPIKNQLVKQLLTKLIRPYELDSSNTYHFYNLNPDRVYRLKFSLQLQDFSKQQLIKSEPQLTNCRLISRTVTVNHFKNLVNFNYKYQPFTNCVSLHTPNPIQLYRYPFQDRLFSILRSGTFPDIKKNLSKFDTIFATSKYTASWINKYWDCNASILYPPVEFVKFRKTPKKKIITSVGRFFVAGHNKKQEVMISAFKDLVDSGMSDWQLHLFGGLSNDLASIKYVENLKKLAHGYSIFLHTNEPRDLVEKTLNESKIYWHAAGYGLDPAKFPERFEHFGITPIEGISAGCIPIVYNGGGLPEVIIESGLEPTQHIFNTLDELKSLTRKVSLSSTKLPSAIIDNLKRAFSRDNFYKHFAGLTNLPPQKQKMV